jgi:NADPH:quinone reductase-like Zn-dependent oxidoreductase
VLLQGTGGVSLFALQFARVSGARTILTTSSSFKVQRALALGADVVINSTETPEWDARVREITGGEGVDHVVDVGGASSLPRSLRAVRKGGTISVIGVLSGNRAELPLTQILMRDLNIHGIFCGSRRVFEAMNRAISVHGLRPVVDRVIPFQEAPAAFRCLETSAHFGKIVIEH